MKELVYNENNLKEEELNNKEIRVKVLLINSQSEVLIGYAHNTYQFIGGHVEEKETFKESIEREIQEETGIILNIFDSEPFFTLKYLLKDYPTKGLYTGSYIYYYAIETDQHYNLDNVNYTEDELKGHFQLKYIPLNDLERVLKDAINKSIGNKTIHQEMLFATKQYQKLCKK